MLNYTFKVEDYLTYRAEIITLLDSLFTDPPYPSYLNMEPSWLRDPRGSRLRIDVFYPDFPLAIIIPPPPEEILYNGTQTTINPPESEWIMLETVKRELASQDIPLVILRPIILNEQVLARLIRASLIENIFAERIESILANVGL